MKSKELRKKAQDFSRALTKAPKMLKDELAIQNHRGQLKKIHPLKVKHEGVTYETMLSLHKQLQEGHNELKELISTAELAITAILVEYGYESSNIELKPLIEDVRYLKLIHPHKSYVNYIEDDKGYIVGSVAIHQIMESGDIPDDYDKGYWKIIDGAWNLDEDRYNQFWGLM